MNPFALSGLLIGLSCTAMAALVFLKNPTNNINKLWSLFCILVSIWGFGDLSIGFTQNSNLAHTLWRLMYVSVIFIPSLFYHFVLVFLGIQKRLTVIFGYAVSTCFLIANATPLMIPGVTRLFDQIYYLAPPGTLYPYFVFFFLLMVTISHIHLWQFMKTTRESLRQTQVRWFFMATAIGFTGGASCYLPVFGINIYPYGNFAVVLYPLIMSYAIIKHQLLDIRIVIKKTIRYSFVISLVSIGYVAVIFAAHKLILGGVPRTFVFQTLLPLYSIPSLIGAILFAALGLFVFLNKPRTKEKIIFSVLCFQTLFWELVWFNSFFVHDDVFLTYLVKIVYLTIVPLPFTFYYFIVSYLRQKMEYKYVVAFYVFALMLMALIFPTTLFVKEVQHFDWGNFSQAGPLYILFMIGAFISMIRGLLILWRALHDAKDNPAAQNQIRYLLLGFGLYFFCTLDFFQVYGAKWFPVGTFFFILSFLVIAYAISKHQLLDVRIVIKKTLFYSAMTVTVSLIYLSLVLILHTFFIKSGKESSPFLVNFAGILFVAITFKPLEIALHKLMERRFFKGTISEIAEQKEKLETELERRERLKSVGILAAGMAHEIKNPITAIKTFAEYLPKKYEDPDFREKFCKIILQESGRIERIVKDLLMFSKPSEPNKTLFDVQALLQSTVDLLTVDMLKSKITPRIECDPAAGQAYADLSQIKQVILNLLTNAVDAMKEKGGELTVRTAISGAFIEISIEDQGCGIATEKIPHLFDPFYTDKENGTGLGLSVTHSLIEKNEGRIEVQSKLGKGTKFTVWLKRERMP